MKRLAWIARLLFFLLIPACGAAQTAALSGYCTLGSSQALVQGLPSSNYQLGVIPSCTVTVYLTGTTTPATIYANGSGGALGNPFTAPSSGQWAFFAATNVGYDVVLSGGSPPNTYPAPVTFTDVLIGGGGGGNCGYPPCVRTDNTSPQTIESILNAPSFNDGAQTNTFTVDGAFLDSWGSNQGGWCLPNGTSPFIAGQWSAAGNCWMNLLINQHGWLYGQTIGTGGSTHGSQWPLYNANTASTPGVIQSVTWKPHSIVLMGLGINDGFGAASSYIDLVNNPTNGATVCVQAPGQGSPTCTTYSNVACTPPGSGNTVCIDSRGPFYTTANWKALYCPIPTFAAGGPTPPGFQQSCASLVDPNFGAYFYDANVPQIGVLRLTPVSITAGPPTITTSDPTDIQFAYPTATVLGSQAAAATAIQQSQYVQTGAEIIEMTAPLASQSEGGVVSHVYAQAINNASGCSGATNTNNSTYGTGFYVLLAANGSCTVTLEGSAFYVNVEMGTGLTGSFTLCATPTGGAPYCAPNGPFTTGLSGYGPGYLSVGYVAVRPPNSNGPAAVTITNVGTQQVGVIAFASNGGWTGSQNTRFAGVMEEGNVPYSPPWIGNATRAGQRQAMGELSADRAPVVDISGIATVFDCYSNPFGCANSGGSTGGYFHPTLVNAQKFADIWSGFLSGIVSPDKAQAVGNGAYQVNLSNNANAVTANGGPWPSNNCTVGSGNVSQPTQGGMGCGAYSGNLGLHSQMDTGTTYTSTSSIGGFALNQGLDAFFGTTAANLYTPGPLTDSSSLVQLPAVTGLTAGQAYSFRVHATAVVGGIVQLGAISGTTPTCTATQTFVLTFANGGTATVTCAGTNTWASATYAITKNGSGAVANTATASCAPGGGNPGASCGGATVNVVGTVSTATAVPFYLENQNGVNAAYAYCRPGQEGFKANYQASGLGAWYSGWCTARDSLLSISAITTGSGNGTVTLTNFSNCGADTSAIITLISGSYSGTNVRNPGTACTANNGTATCTATSGTAACSGTVTVTTTTGTQINPTIVNASNTPAILQVDSYQVWSGSAAQQGNPVNTTAAGGAVAPGSGLILNGVVQPTTPGTLTGITTSGCLSGSGTSGSVAIGSANCAVVPPNTTVSSATGGSGTGTITCTTATCTSSSGTYSVAGGTFATGNLLTLVWPTTTAVAKCTVTQNGGVATYGIGHALATATGLVITNGITVAGVTVTVDYSCSQY